MQKGDVYLADLNPVVGSEQAGTRPVVIIQNSALNRVTRTVVIVPFTSNLRRAELPTGTLIPKGEGGLSQDSVALCHQIRVLDKSRLTARLGKLSNEWMTKIDETLAFVLDM
ncbi:MAG: type II toxin-antitoxin system PemK/MazF family toxin [Chloroflexi bacterium]|nr:type II toxin-antitoxin system PemK/MazF family toxin [Chloroflexota bacterium]